MTASTDCDLSVSETLTLEHNSIMMDSTQGRHISGHTSLGTKKVGTLPGDIKRDTSRLDVLNAGSSIEHTACPSPDGPDKLLPNTWYWLHSRRHSSHPACSPLLELVEPVAASLSFRVYVSQAKTARYGGVDRFCLHWEVFQRMMVPLCRPTFSGALKHTARIAERRQEMADMYELAANLENLSLDIGSYRVPQGPPRP